MIVQEGKYYIDGNGEKHGPMVREPRGWFYVEDKLGCWYRDGECEDSSTESSIGPLVAEWTDGPVRTVTRTVTEVVEGVYGILEVGKATTMPTQCGSDEESPVVYVSIVTAYSTSIELKAAAAVLLELAGALE